MNRPFLTLLALFSALAPLHARDWTSARGQKMTADFVAANETTVTLRWKDGRLFNLPLRMFSEGDLEFIAKQRAEAPSSRDIAKYVPQISGEWVYNGTDDGPVRAEKKTPREGEPRQEETVVHDYELPYAFYAPRDADWSKTYPLIVVLHETGFEDEALQQKGIKGEEFNLALAKQIQKTAAVAKAKCLILAPFCPEDRATTMDGWIGSPAEKTVELIKDLRKNLPLVDRNRIYLIGHSMGGIGTWQLLADQPTLFAGAIAASGHLPDPEKLPETPLWAFHGAQDKIVPVKKARVAASELKDVTTFKYTEFAKQGHSDIMSKILGDEAVLPWLLEQKRKTE